MCSNERNRLWNPSSGFKFSSNQNPSSVFYPQLELTRFLHGYSLSLSPNIDHDADATEPCHQEMLKDVSAQSSVAAIPELYDGKHAEGSAPEVVDTNFEVEAPTQTTPLVPKATAVPPVTSLDYNISSDLFYAARDATEGSPESFWSHTMYESRGPEGAVQKVKVHYCTSKHTTEYVCKKYFLGEKVLGFDLEWFPYATKASGPRENVSLIQIASPGRIGLFHVALFPQRDELVAPTFRKIMEDPEVSKVGVNIQADCTRLKNNLAVDSRGIFELSHLYKLVKYSAEGCVQLINKKRVALAVQVEDVLRLPLYKGDSVRSSNWTKTLNQRQISYSAADAYAGLQLFYVLEDKRKQLKPTPPRPGHAELGLPIRIALPTPDSSDIDEETTTSSTEAAAPRKHESAAVQKNLPVRKPSAQKDPRIEAADLRLKQYRSELQRPLKASPSAVRAYFIWQANEDLNPEAIARLLREPPLKTNTVVTYILDSLSAENLPYSTSRLKDELLSQLAVDIATIRKYHTLAEAVHGP